MSRKGSYLFKRRGSQNWWIRFQYTGLMAEKKGIKKREFSLNTSNREEAELLAMEHVFIHKASLLLAKSHKQTPLFRETGNRLFEAGIHELEEGGYVYATKDKLSYFHKEGEEAYKTIDNVAVRVSLADNLFADKDFVDYVNSLRSNTNDSFIDVWIRQRGIDKHLEAEARTTWSLCQTLTNNKSLKKMTRDDGRKLVDKLIAIGNGPATIAKKVGHLRAAANIALDDGKATLNPFSKITPKYRKGSSGRILHEEDMTLIRDNLGYLSVSDQTLWKLLACTGMRLGEAFQINEEFAIGGIRYVVIGTKTETSIRKVPLPAQIIPLIPERIIGPLFPGKAEVAGKRLRYFLRKIGVSYDTKLNTGDKRKVIHSLRHRAKDRLRELKCKVDVQHEILGHDKKTVADRYGNGYPIAYLKEWIDQIGY